MSDERAWMVKESVRLPRDLRDAAKRKAATVIGGFSAYVRNLIERDLRRSGEWWKPR